MAIGVAIIGSGIFAREEHLPAVRATKDLDLKAIYSRSLKSAQSLCPDTKVDLYSDDSGSGKGFADLLKSSNVQAVIIALPIVKQSEYIRQALLAGKHVLSEKPVGENLKDAQALLKWYYENVDNYARQQVHRAGKVLQFKVKAHSMVKPGGKYFETEWRKNPTHQGGFLLDGGVHQIAGLRLLLGPENTIDRVAAYSAQLQEHLPPLDTIDAIMKTRQGATGTFSLSFGTTFKGSEWAIACEGGSVSVSRSTVTTVFDGREEVVEIKDERSGVPPEVRTWGEALVKGVRDEKQTPGEALADLELLENMLKSGDANGQPLKCILQI